VTQKLKVEKLRLAASAELKGKMGKRLKGEICCVAKILFKAITK
jgi:hypothetical protein